MLINHRISFHSTPEVQRVFHSIGVSVGDSGFVSIDVRESDPEWAAVRALVEERGFYDNVSTIYLEEEIDAAGWLHLDPSWHHGYPQPEDDFGYLDITYDTTSRCPLCGIGGVQKAPFRMKGEPKWGRRGILQLNWVFDEYFVKPDIWRAVFEPRGVGARQVLDPEGHVLRSVLQLVVEEHVSVATKGLESLRCELCSRVKYSPVTRGPFPRLNPGPSGPMAKTDEYFGSGHRAYQAVLVSQSLAREMKRSGLRGVVFEPLAPMSDNACTA